MLSTQKNNYTDALTRSQVQALIAVINAAPTNGMSAAERVETAIYQAGLYGHITWSSLDHMGSGYAVVLSNKWLLVRSGAKYGFVERARG